jgi:tRNA:m4X modification enzyme
LNCFEENNFYLVIADKAFLSGLGIAEEEFHAMTWFSSWAVDGDHSSQDS